MAPVLIEPNASYGGAATVALHFVGIVYCTLKVVNSLHQSYKSLSPSQEVRLRIDRRKRLVPLFSGLAVLALAAAAWSVVVYLLLSFQVWADTRDVGANVEIGYIDPSVPTIQRPISMKQIIQWLSDTPVYQDAFEIMAEKARRFWWSQQVDMALIPWSLLLALEGTRRRIPHLLAFLCLAHLVSLSFAQNLFFVSLLLTPTPLPEEISSKSSRADSRIWTWAMSTIFPPKPAGWTLEPGFYLISVLASYGTALIIPPVAETPPLGRAMATSRALTFVPLLLQTIVPRSWGAIHTHHHDDASDAFTDLFRLMSIASIVLHSIATFHGLRCNVPHAHYHRHSKFLPWDIEERSRWERTTTAVGKLLGATRDHPVVTAVGYDVLLSGLSTGLWAAVRSLQANDILRSVVPLYGQSLHQADDQARCARDGPQRAKHDPEEDPSDETYEPTPGEKCSAQGDALPTQKMDWDAAGLGWGLLSVGGLGLGCAGVFGGEFLAS